MHIQYTHPYYTHIQHTHTHTWYTHTIYTHIQYTYTYNIYTHITHTQHTHTIYSEHTYKAPALMQQRRLCLTTSSHLVWFRFVFCPLKNGKTATAKHNKGNTKNCSEEVPRTSKTEKDKPVFIKFTAQSTVQGYTIKAKDNERKTMMIKLKWYTCNEQAHNTQNTRDPPAIELSVVDAQHHLKGARMKDKVSHILRRRPQAVRGTLGTGQGGHSWHRRAAGTLRAGCWTNCWHCCRVASGGSHPGFGFRFWYGLLPLQLGFCCTWGVWGSRYFVGGGGDRGSSRSGGQGVWLWVTVTVRDTVGRSAAWVCICHGWSEKIKNIIYNYKSAT